MLLFVTVLGGFRVFEVSSFDFRVFELSSVRVFEMSSFLVSLFFEFLSY